MLVRAMLGNSPSAVVARLSSRCCCRSVGWQLPKVVIDTRMMATAKTNDLGAIEFVESLIFSATECM